MTIVFMLYATFSALLAYFGIKAILSKNGGIHGLYIEFNIDVVMTFNEKHGKDLYVSFKQFRYLVLPTLGLFLAVSWPVIIASVLYKKVRGK